MGFAEKITNAYKQKTLMSTITRYDTHISRHQNVEELKALEQVIAEGRNFRQQNKSISAFHQDFPVEDAIAETLLQNANRIEAWLNNPNSSPSEAFCTAFPDKETGKGFINDRLTNRLAEYTTDGIRVILRKHNNSALGFSLVTAYPEMWTTDVQPTGRDLSELIRQTKQYQEGDPLYQTFLLERTQPKQPYVLEYKPGKTPDDSVMFLNVPTQNPNIEHQIKIKENKMFLTTQYHERTEDGRHKKTAIPTQYTELYENTMKSYGRNFVNKNYTVPLTNKEVNKAFYHDYPELFSVTTRIRKRLQAHMPEERRFVPKPRPLPSVADKLENPQKPNMVSHHPPL